MLETGRGVCFLGILTFCRPSPNIPDRIARSLLTTNCRDTCEDLGLLANFREKLGIGEVRDVIRHLKFTKGPGSLGMDGTLWDTLAGKMSEDLNGLGV